jgi:FkbM family methyltransferase
MSQESLLVPGSVPRISFAPNHEDILLDRLFGDHVGTFMAVGASMPTHGSLTYFFYRRGWRGVNLEPIPRLRVQLDAARPGDLNLPLAAWDANGEIPFLEIATAGPGGPSTYPASLAEEYRMRSIAVEERRVPVRTIQSLVEELEIEPPDFLAIDADGTEEMVIRGIRLAQWRPRVIVVGSNRPDATPRGHRGWESILLGHGYCFALCNGFNRFFLRDDLDHLRHRLEPPIGELDRLHGTEAVAPDDRRRDLEPRLNRWRIDAPHLRDEREDPPASAPRRRLDPLGVIALGDRWIRHLMRPRSSSAGPESGTGDHARPGSP